MNTSHLKSIAGILHLISLVTCLLAAAIGAAAFSTSAYNKSCKDGDSNFDFSVKPTDSSSSSTTFTTIQTSLSTVSQIPETSSINYITTLQEQDPQSTTEPDQPKDMAPVLWMEKIQISVTTISFIISLISLILYVVVESLDVNKYFKAVNFSFHFLFCVLLMISAIFLAFATVEIDKKICQNNFDNREDCQKYKLKMSAAAFSLLTAVLYAAISVKIISSKLYEQV